MTYAYQARDSSGKIVGGTQDALNEENAINTLMSRGLMVLSIQQRAAASTFGVSKKVHETDLVLFTRQLATMVDAGLPITTGLTALFEQCDPRKQAGLRRIIGEITAVVQNGGTFTEAIMKHPRIFNRLYVAMVRAGEAGGLFAEILSRLATFLEASARLRKKIKSALTYPVVVLSLAFTITAFLIVFCVPTFGEVFADMGGTLPGPTQFLIDLSDFVRGSWYIIILGIMSVIFGWKAFVRSKSGGRLWDQWQLKLPVFGPLLRKVAMTRFARTFAQLIRAGVPILEVMDIVGDTSGNSVVTDAIKEVSSDVEKGDHLSAGMSRQPIFPPMLVRMVSAGEQTGKIDAMLEKMADFWDEEIEAMLATLTSLLEPILIVTLGIIVGSIVICLFLPIFKLGDMAFGG